MNHQQQQVVRLPEPNEMGQLVIRGITSFARRNKVITGVYLFGWIFLLFIGSGTQLTISQQRAYNRIMDSIDVQTEYDATSDYWQARNRYHNSRGWFWTCNDRYCQQNKIRYEQAE